MQLRITRTAASVLLLLLLAGAVRATDWDRGVAAYNKGDYRRALVEFQDITRERPDAAGAWYYIGLCEFKLKRYVRVELPLSHAIDLLEVQSPASADIAGAWYTIGISHYLASEYEKAIDPLKRYLALTAKAKHDIDPSASTALARSYFFLERYDEALPLLSATAGAAKPDKPGAPSADKPPGENKAKESAASSYYLGVIY